MMMSTYEVDLDEFVAAADKQLLMCRWMETSPR